VFPFVEGIEVIIGGDRIQPALIDAKAGIAIGPEAALVRMVLYSLSTICHHRKAAPFFRLRRLYSRVYLQEGIILLSRRLYKTEAMVGRSPLAASISINEAIVIISL
jgi:hypothetical protein